MRYGNPNIANALKELHSKGVDEVLLIPLYPQYAMATTETIEVLTDKLIKASYPNMRLTKFPAFFHRPEYIEALAQVVRAHLGTAALFLSRCTRASSLQNHTYLCTQTHCRRCNLLRPLQRRRNALLPQSLF